MLNKWAKGLTRKVIAKLGYRVSRVAPSATAIHGIDEMEPCLQHLRHLGLDRSASSMWGRIAPAGRRWRPASSPRRGSC
jgi:hypothetical protein